ncbi:MAG: T9SS type A sorting domain-containing protein [Vicingaceae bacterium]|nr:T9SS type A sorting domain-containing protein [Vicingaceae bacterium]
MIKRILFISSIFLGGFASAQTFQIMDHYDVSIEGTSHYERGSLQALSETKFHVKSLATSGSAVYSSKVYEMVNPKQSDLQVCYGANCYTGDAGVAGAQTNGGTVTMAAGTIDSTFKVAPFTFTWATGDSARWRVTVYNVANPNDSSSAIITWKEGFPVSIKTEVSKNDVKLSAYPNPASSLLNVNYNVDTDASANVSIDVYDVVGKKVTSHKVINNKGQVQLNVSDLNSGVYFYSLNVNGQAIKTERIIIN